MAENRYEHYRRRLRALGLTTDELGEELRMYLAPLKDVIDYRKGKIDAHVNDLMDDRVSRIEASIEDTAFIPPPCDWTVLSKSAAQSMGSVWV